MALILGPEDPRSPTLLFYLSQPWPHSSDIAVGIARVE